MKPTTMLESLLVVLGMFALIYPGFSYTRREKVPDLGPIHATRDDTERIPIPPSAGRIGSAGRRGVARHRLETKSVIQLTEDA
jgi:hypothetical protein